MYDLKEFVATLQLLSRRSHLSSYYSSLLYHVILVGFVQFC